MGVNPLKLVPATFVALLVAQSSPVSPFEGDWRIDVPAGFERGSGGSVPSGISFAVTRETVKLTERQVTPGRVIEGKLTLRTIEGEETLRIDGKPHPSRNGPGWVTVAKWSNPNVLDVVDTGSGERTVTVHRTYSLAADRKTLTRRSVYSWNGYVAQVIFHR